MTDTVTRAQTIAQMPIREAMAEIASLPEHEKSGVLAELAKQHGLGGHRIGQVILNLPMIVHTLPADPITA